MAKLVQIYLRPSTRTPVKPVTRATALADRGLEGDHAGGGKRQVTLISRQSWDDALAQLGGGALDPGTRRANLLIDGLDLGPLIGRRVRVGPVELQVEGETRPCGLMDDARLGLRDALAPACRGGVFARILTGGPLQVGDEVSVLEPGAV